MGPRSQRKFKLLPGHTPQNFLDPLHILLNHAHTSLPLGSAVLSSATPTPLTNPTAQSFPASVSILALTGCVALARSLPLLGSWFLLGQMRRLEVAIFCRQSSLCQHDSGSACPSPRRGPSKSGLCFGAAQSSSSPLSSPGDRRVPVTDEGLLRAKLIGEAIRWPHTHRTLGEKPRGVSGKCKGLGPKAAWVVHGMSCPRVTSHRRALLPKEGHPRVTFTFAPRV